MLKKTNGNSGQSMIPNKGPIIPDPWENGRAEAHFPSPMEWDRLLRESYPLLSAADSYLMIGAADLPVGLLSPAHTHRAL